MLETFLWGAVRGVLVVDQRGDRPWVRLPERLLGIVTAFGAGVLIRTLE